MSRLAIAGGVVICAMTAQVEAAGQKAEKTDSLMRARAFYNGAQYDDAIVAAEVAAKSTSEASASLVVLARAHLERYRRSGDAADLTAAHDAITRIAIASLPARDRVEFTLAQGESLYFEDRFGAAAEMFELVLARVDVIGAASRDSVLEWWAGAIDRQAQFSPESVRSLAYARVVRRMEDELARNPVSPVAAYWLTASAAGMDDGERAWSAAQAAWVRAPQMGTDGARLRADLDHLVRDVVIPTCARSRTQGDPTQTIAALRAAWDEFKSKWAVSERPPSLCELRRD